MSCLYHLLELTTEETYIKEIESCNPFFFVKTIPYCTNVFIANSVVMADLADLVSRLEAVTVRLEKCAAGGGGKASAADDDDDFG